jgi:hypothetical protein
MLLLSLIFLDCRLFFCNMYQSLVPMVFENLFSKCVVLLFTGHYYKVKRIRRGTSIPSPSQSSLHVNKFLTVLSQSLGTQFTDQA